VAGIRPNQFMVKVAEIWLFLSDFGQIGRNLAHYNWIPAN
jgi:hypothetical protein